MGDEPEIQVAERAGVGIDGQDRPTEDRVVVLPNAVVLLDGATALRPGARTGGWYADQLSTALAGGLSKTPTGDLTVVLAEAITAVAAEHGLVPGNSPASTVAIIRWTETTLDALVLADSPVVVFTDSGHEVLADSRLVDLRLPRPSAYRQRLRGGAGYGPEHVAALRSSGAEIGKLRNVPGGFWVAEADPAAAAHACTASWPLATIRSAMLASDGVSCGVDDYRLFDWPEALALARQDGPGAVLRAVRAAERDDPDGARWPRPKRHDDQALVLLRFDQPSRPVG
ncbi:MAG TPA: hypothetical protein VHW44_32475 [Pseudonocardiaceae bacterium]|nr:hypothetical protein [Pseudonocardiaceae bacterium]